MISKKQHKKTLFTDKFLLSCLCLSLVLLSGCSNHKPRVIPDEVIAEINAKPKKLQDLYKLHYQEGQRNHVLNNMHIGVAAMEIGNFPIAKQVFTDAILEIEKVYSDTDEAAKARSLWYEEGSKIFKGEPYERASIYYYLGLIDLMEGDYENARAAFKSGILQDAFAEEKQFQCDFALLIFLEGWASHLLGDEDYAKQAFSEVKKLRPDFKFPDKNHNTLLIAETGRSPRKVADGVGHSELKYRRGKAFKENRVIFSIDDTKIAGYPMEDIYFQAASRGGRAVDKLIEGKAVFRKQASNIGLTLSDIANKGMLVSPLLGSAGGAASAVSGGLAVLGAVTTIAAIHANPHADVRYWKNLSDTIHIATLESTEVDTQFNISFADRNGKDYMDLKSEPAPKARDNQNIYWVRSRSSFNEKNKWHNIFNKNK